MAILYGQGESSFTTPKERQSGGVVVEWNDMLPDFGSQGPQFKSRHGAIVLIPPSHRRIFLTSPYGSPTRSQSQASVNNSLVSVNNSSQLATTRRHS